MIAKNGKARARLVALAEAPRTPAAIRALRGSDRISRGSRCAMARGHSPRAGRRQRDRTRRCACFLESHALLWFVAGSERHVRDSPRRHRTGGQRRLGELCQRLGADDQAGREPAAPAVAAGRNGRKCVDAADADRASPYSMPRPGSRRCMAIRSAASWWPRQSRMGSSWSRRIGRSNAIRLRGSGERASRAWPALDQGACRSRYGRLGNYRRITLRLLAAPRLADP